jgi:uncharacterized membrane protein
MKSKAAIGNHPIHPMLVAVPIGTFALLFIGDLAKILTGDAFWYHFAIVCLMIGIVSALLAAIFGLIDYIAVTMSKAGRKLATAHLIINTTAILLYIFDGWLRFSDRALGTGRWIPAVAIEIAALALLGSSGWIGGKMTFEHKIGVVENADQEATTLGSREAL